MRTLVQISDLHFGRIDPRLPGPLARTLHAIAPDLLVVSGDLTQRARVAQFRAAAEYLATLPKPQIVIPGNHDVPLYDVARRFLSPLTRFRRYISDEPYPTYVDDEIAVVGVNTARSLTFKGGRINATQAAEIERRFAGLPERVTRVVVTHHPFDLPEGGDEEDIVGRSSMAMEAFARCGVDVLLSGHLHRTHAASTAHRYRIAGFAALVVQAGTATSTRGRGEANSFNVLRIDRDTRLDVEAWSWNDAAGEFAVENVQRFDYRSGRGWARLDAQP